MLISLGIRLGAYPQKTQQPNPPTLSGRAIGRATAVGNLTVTRPLAGIATGRATTVGALTVTRPLAGVAIGRATTVGALTVAASFTPASIAGLQAWFDASQITGLADGAPIPQWNDLSGNLRHATQATAAAQPLYKTAILNGKPVVRFDGVDDVLRTGVGFTVAQPTTVIAVVKVVAGDTSNPYLLDSADSTARQYIRRNSTRYAISAGVILAPTGTTVAAADVVTAIYNTTTSASFLNGTSLASGDAGTQGMKGIGMGATALNSGFANVDIAEYVIYNSALSTTDRQAVEHYLGTKWGIVVA